MDPSHDGTTCPQGRITRRVHARVGLLGNPSDGYFGKTISLSLENFFSEVTLTPSDTIIVKPHPLHDATEFESLEALARRVEREGYYGGLRLLMAICRRFFKYCKEKHVRLEDKGFTLEYETNIPRQTGLSGSSSIITAALDSLLDFYGVAQQVAPSDRPGLVLSAESDLGITAGLQDRVIQVYGGVVYMDFEREYLERHGHGRYSHIEPSLLPKLHLMYSANPSDSGAVHSDVKRRWTEGDPEVQTAMSELADIADAGRDAIQAQEWTKLAALMNRNFDIRRHLFGDEALGALNIRMVELARQVGAAGKFTGSGGAIVVLCAADEQEKHLEELCTQAGLEFVRIDVAPALHDLPTEAACT